MEFWVERPEVLKTMARHWRTGEPMPSELIERIRAAKTFRAATFICRQLEFAMTDLALHDASFVPSRDPNLRAPAEMRPALPAIAKRAAPGRAGTE